MSPVLAVLEGGVSSGGQLLTQVRKRVPLMTLTSCQWLVPCVDDTTLEKLPLVFDPVPTGLTGVGNIESTRTINDLAVGTKFMLVKLGESKMTFLTQSPRHHAWKSM